MHEHNAYVRSFRAIASHTDCKDRNILLKASNKGQDARRYNLPTASEVAAIIPRDETKQVDKRDIVVYVNRGGVRHISDANEAYIPLHFVLLFPSGEAGWHPGIPKTMLSNPQEDIGDGVEEETRDRVEEAIENILNDNEGRDGGNEPQLPREEGPRRTVSAREFVAFRLHARRNISRSRARKGGDRLLRFGRLTEEWIVDVYGTIQAQRLEFHYKNQDKYRAHSFRAVRDAWTSNDVNISNMGRRVILPSSFVGGPRHMHQLYQDAMSIVRVYGKPDYFLTMTCNPNWQEIQKELLPGQTWCNRPDLVARVFRQKQKALLDLIMKQRILGRVVAHIY